MRLLDRRWFVLGLALILCLALLGRWVMLPRDAVNAPARVERLASIDGLNAKAQPPAIAEPSSNIAPSPDDSAPSFGTLRGRVIDAVTREPVREFEVQFHGTRATRAGHEAPGAQTFRTGDGRFEWQHVLPGEWPVTASARGYQRFELSVQIVSGQATPEIVLPLRPGQRLQGRVYDDVSGVGIAAASIGFREWGVGRFEGNWRMRVHVTTRKNGAFVLEGVPPGRITLEVSARDYAARELVALVGEETAPLEISLSAGGTIAGHLTAADGVTPVTGAVGLFHLDQRFGGTSRTGEAGEFSFQHLAAGRYRLTGHALGGTVERDIVLAGNDRIEGIVIAIAPSTGPSIRGMVTGVRSEDFKRISISLRRDGDGGNFGSQVGVDDRGAYALHGVQPGRVQVVADVSMRRQLSRTIEMPADSDITVDLNFPSGARLSGRVTRGGKPLPGVWLEPQPVVEQKVYVYGTSTSEEGKYAIDDLPTGEYNMWVGEYRSKPVELSGNTVFDIDIPLAHFSGRVLEEGGKLPVVGADVDVWPAEPGSSRHRLRTRSDHFGQFALVGFEPGDFLLTAYKPGYEMFRKRISYASPVAGMTISLRPNSGVEIRARDAGSGKPLQQVYVIEALGDRDGSRLQLHLDENGIGHIPGALAGSTLSFAASGYAPVVISAWSGQALDLRLVRQDTQ